MNVEGMAFVYNEGVHRINLGYDIYRRRPGLLKENCTGPTKKVADNIRSLSIQVKVKDFSSSRSRHTGEFQHLDTLMGFPLKHKLCIIWGCCVKYAKHSYGPFL